MNSKHSPVSIRQVSSFSTLISDVLSSTPLTPEYEDVLKFACEFNLNRCMKNEKSLLPAAVTTLLTATKNYVLAGQAMRIPPSELKKQVATTAREDRSHHHWVPNVEQEQSSGLMAGSTATVSPS